MRHDELLKDIKDNADYGYIPGQPDPIAAALIAVVELHRPYKTKTGTCCVECPTKYPCPTIKAIKKELT
jgi:hypothetical protein